MFDCCSLPSSTPALLTHPDLKDWLDGISLGQLHPKFVESGYEDHEQIMFLMTSDFALNDAVLEHDI